MDFVLYLFYFFVEFTMLSNARFW